MRKSEHQTIAVSEELGKSAFDYIDRMSRMTNLDEVVALASDTLRDFGFKAFALVDIPSSILNSPFRVLVHETPPGWVDLYLKEGYAANDPVLRQSLLTRTPFEWQDVQYNHQTMHNEQEVMHRATDFGLRHGFSFSARQADGPTSCVSIAGPDRANLDAATKPIIHLISLYTLARAQDLRQPSSDKSLPSLSAREREVLTWIAVGKKDNEIAGILGLSQRTVLAHAINAMRKLGASGRTHTVARAIALGLIKI